MYVAIKRFEDLQDNNRVYEPGEIFPREGFEVDKIRIEELSSKKNRRATQVIARLKGLKDVADKKLDEEINIEELSKADLVEIAKEKEIEGYSTMKKAELIEVIKGE